MTLKQQCPQIHVNINENFENVFNTKMLWSKQRKYKNLHTAIGAFYPRKVPKRGQTMQN
jgi:cytochrome c peroxidase